MPLVEKIMSEVELRESIARLDRLAKANPAMARDFSQRSAEARKQLNQLLLDKGGYSVTKDADVAAAIEAARREGYESGVADEQAKVPPPAPDDPPTYEEFNSAA